MVIKTVVNLDSNEFDIVSKMDTLLTNFCESCNCDICPYCLDEDCKIAIAKDVLNDLKNGITIEKEKR